MRGEGGERREGKKKKKGEERPLSPLSKEEPRRWWRSGWKREWLVTGGACEAAAVWVGGNWDGGGRRRGGGGGGRGDGVGAGGGGGER